MPQVKLEKVDGSTTLVSIDNLVTSSGDRLEFDSEGRLLGTERPSIPRNKPPEHDLARDIQGRDAAAKKEADQGNREAERNKKRSS